MTYQQPTTTGYSYPPHSSLNSSYDPIKFYNPPYRAQPTSSSSSYTMSGSYNYNQPLDGFNGSTNFNSMNYSTHQQQQQSSSSSQTLLPSNAIKPESEYTRLGVPNFNIEPVNTTDLKPLHPPQTASSSSSSLPIPQSSLSNTRYLHSPLEYTPTVSKLPFVTYANNSSSNENKIPFTAHSFESSHNYHYNHPIQQQGQQQQQFQQPLSSQSQQFLPLPQLYYPQSSSTRSSSFSETTSTHDLSHHGNVHLINDQIDFSDDAVTAAIKAAEVSAAETIGRKKRRTRKTCILTKKEAETAKIETFECPHCSKIFSRLYNLKSHLKTHSDEKPFNCSYCERSFARNHDRKRHELLHQGEKKFQCGGILSDKVTKWGCGKKFARADGLGRHFRTETGWLCIRPLMIEAKELEQKENLESVKSGGTSELSSNDEIINRIIGRSS